MVSVRSKDFDDVLWKMQKNIYEIIFSLEHAATREIFKTCSPRKKKLIYKMVGFLFFWGQLFIVIEGFLAQMTKVKCVFNVHRNIF